MRSCFKFALFVCFLWKISFALAGSYDDYFAALSADNPTTVQTLLERGFDPNSVNLQGEPSLILAVRQGALKVVDVLLAHPATRVETRTLQDESPLMLAALKGYKDVCQKLIARDADVNKPGWTPLHYAATGGHETVMRLLLENHAYIDAASPNGSTPLMLAAKYSSAAAVQLLLEAGADPALKNDAGLTAIDFAVSAQRQDSVGLIAAAIRAQAPRGSW